MKNILQVFALTFLCVGCSSDDNNSSPSSDLYLDIPDAEFESKLINLGIDSDGVINKRMLKADAINVTDLNLDFSGAGEIKDLTGIEGFINLKNLSAIQNKIPAVNLEFNKKLETLFLAGNLLTSIDLSFNTNLIDVNIESNNLTTFTGISNAISLKELNLSFNSLKAFSINNPALETLFISDNLLKTFNADGAFNLKNIFIKSNLIDIIDVSNNALLETLVVSDNKIQSVNLEQNTKLTHIYISSNLLTSLDVSSLQNLIWLTINNNPSLSCVKIENGQNIPTVTKLENQELNTVCN